MQAAKRAPRDPDLRRKLTECEKAVKRIKFEEALATPVRALGEGCSLGFPLGFQVSRRPRLRFLGDRPRCRCVC